MPVLRRERINNLANVASDKTFFLFFVSDNVVITRSTFWIDHEDL